MQSDYPQTPRARELRSSSTDAERQLWQRLRARQLGGFRFRRQQPIGPYFADFACLSVKLIVEVDGRQHADSESDQRRDQWFRTEGFAVLRYWNNDVLSRSDSVAEAIYAALILQASSPLRGED